MKIMDYCTKPPITDSNIDRKRKIKIQLIVFQIVSVAFM